MKKSNNYLILLLPYLIVFHYILRLVNSMILKGLIQSIFCGDIVQSGRLDLSSHDVRGLSL